MKEKFLKYIDNMKTDSIKNFAKYVFKKIPKYFWTSLASPSGKFHGGESLVDHVLGCLFMVEKVCDQFASIWTQEEKDCLMFSLMFHDAWKSGDGKGPKYTKEDFENGFCLESSIGVLKSNKDHPKIAYDEIKKLSISFNKCAENKLTIDNEILICQSIRYHMGPWTQEERSSWEFLFSLPYSSVIVQTHNIDYHQSKNKSFKND